MDLLLELLLELLLVLLLLLLLYVFYPVHLEGRKAPSLDFPTKITRQGSGMFGSRAPQHRPLRALSRSDWPRSHPLKKKSQC